MSNRESGLVVLCILVLGSLAPAVKVQTRAPTFQV
jgi:hypothetical protein